MIYLNIYRRKNGGPEIETWDSDARYMRQHGGL